MRSFLGRTTLLLCIILLAGCAPATVGSKTGASPSQGGTTATASAPAQSSITGCPGPTQEVNWPSAPTVVATSQQHATPITVHVGDTFEITLPMGHKWALTPGQPGAMLRLDAPAGYGDTAQNMCVWHFTTLASGQDGLEYSMQALCPKGTQCPHYITLLDFTVVAS